jgi:trans-aconitate methyltransferase
MTEFAQNNYPSDTIEYLTQDIGKPWDELNPKLKELEGKVSLVFSNRVLHWVEDKETAAKNISKFLKSKGDLYTNITVISSDITQQLSKELREKFNKVPTVEEQFEIWQKIFTNEGIELSFKEIKYSETYYEKNAVKGKMFNS